MRIARFLFLGLFLSARLSAQVPDGRMNAIGIVGETNGLFSGINEPSATTVGIQYNKKVNKHIGYKVSLGYCGYSQAPETYPVRLVSTDTAIGRGLNINVGMCMVGLGINFERQFYKKLFLFAGFEIRAGYGNGELDTTIVKESYGLQTNPITNYKYQGVSTVLYDNAGPVVQMFYAGLSPLIGLKMDLKNFCIGAEFLSYFWYRSIQPQNKPVDNWYDFDGSNITQRLFVQYKF